MNNEIFSVTILIILFLIIYDILDNSISLVFFAIVSGIIAAVVDTMFTLPAAYIELIRGIFIGVVIISLVKSWFVRNSFLGAVKS